MKTSVTSFTRRSGFVCLAVLCASGVIARAGDTHLESKNAESPVSEPSDPWKFTLALPGWLAATSGTIGLDGINSHVYLGADTLIKHIDMVASVSAEVRKGRLGFYGDFLYVSASDGIGSDGLISKLDVRLDQYLVDLELNYRLLEGPRGWLDLRAGVRYTNVYNKLSTVPNDYAIEQASAKLVDDVADKVKERLSELDLRSRLKNVIEERIRGRITGRLSGLGADRLTLPIAPIGGHQPGVIDDVIRAAIDARVNDLAAALRAKAAAKTEQLRAEADSRINDLKKRISRQVSATLKDKLNNTYSLDEQWWDPYVGVGARYNLSKAFYLTAKGDIGGFGVGSELTWQASGALGCQITRYIFVEAGYRYLYTDYNHNGFVYDVTQSGAQITAGITF